MTEILSVAEDKLVNDATSEPVPSTVAVITPPVPLATLLNLVKSVDVIFSSVIVIATSLS